MRVGRSDMYIMDTNLLTTLILYLSRKSFTSQVYDKIMASPVCIKLHDIKMVKINMKESCMKLPHQGLKIFSVTFKTTNQRINNFFTLDHLLLRTLKTWLTRVFYMLVVIQLLILWLKRMYRIQSHIKLAYHNWNTGTPQPLKMDIPCQGSPQSRPNPSPLIHLSYARTYQWLIAIVQRRQCL